MAPINRWHLLLGRYFVIDWNKSHHFFTNWSNFCYRVSHPKSGRVMEVYSDQPGVQLYTSNYMPDPINQVNCDLISIISFFKSLFLYRFYQRKQYIMLDLSRRKKTRTKSTKWCSTTHFRQRRCTLFQARCFLFGNSKFPRCCESCELKLKIIVSNFFFQFLNLCIRSQTSQVQ